MIKLGHEKFSHEELDIVQGVKNKQGDVIVSLLEDKIRAYVTMHSFG